MKSLVNLKKIKLTAKTVQEFNRQMEFGPRHFSLERQIELVHDIKVEDRPPSKVIKNFHDYVLT